MLYTIDTIYCPVRRSIRLGDEMGNENMGSAIFPVLELYRKGGNLIGIKLKRYDFVVILLS